MKTVKICCVGSSLISIDELEPFQGELKELTYIAYMQCKNSILKLGFSEPITVWKSPIGITYVLGGHQRLKTLLIMRSEGYEIPLIPINEVECKNTQEAKEKVLALTSQFGKITKESLETFCLEDLNIDFDVVVSNYRFPELEMIIQEENITKKGNGLIGDKDTSSETTTIRVTVAHDDRDEAIQKITNALKGMNPDII